MQIVGKTVTVILVQAVFRTHPDIAGLVLADGQHTVARQLIRGKELLRLPHHDETRHETEGQQYGFLHCCQRFSRLQR